MEKGKENIESFSMSCVDCQLCIRAGRTCVQGAAGLELSRMTFLRKAFVTVAYEATLKTGITNESAHPTRRKQRNK